MHILLWYDWRSEASWGNYEGMCVGKRSKRFSGTSGRLEWPIRQKSSVVPVGVWALVEVVASPHLGCWHEFCWEPVFVALFRTLSRDRPERSFGGFDGWARANHDHVLELAKLALENCVEEGRCSNWRVWSSFEVIWSNCLMLPLRQTCLSRIKRVFVVTLDHFSFFFDIDLLFNLRLPPKSTWAVGPGF